MNKCVPITLVTGYLGSGKTTLINNILTNNAGYKIAVIVNDIGEVNIDADLIQKGGMVSGQDDSLVALQNGCICCTLQTELIEQILQLVNCQKFDHILIEASGVSAPMPIVQSILAIENECKRTKTPLITRLDAIVCVTDALRLTKEFDCGNNLRASSYDEDDIEGLVIEQLELCNLVLLNKTDEVEKEELNRVKAVIGELQPVAKIIETNYSKVDIKQIMDTNLFDLDSCIGGARWIKELEADNVGNRDEIIEKKAKGEHIHEHHHHEHHCEHDHNHEHHEHDEKECGHHHDEHCDCGHEHHGEHHHDDGHCHCEGECHCGHHSDVAGYGISTFVYYRRKPFNRRKFLDFMNKDWGRNIIRTKGLLYFSDEIDMSYVFEQAGPQKNLSQTGLWFGAMPKDKVEKMLEQEPLLRKDWDDEFGDRMIKLVFIGQKMDKQNIVDELDSF